MDPNRSPEEVDEVRENQRTLWVHQTVLLEEHETLKIETLDLDQKTLALPGYSKGSSSGPEGSFPFRFGLTDQMKIVTVWGRPLWDRGVSPLTVNWKDLRLASLAEVYQKKKKEHSWPERCRGRP